MFTLFDSPIGELLVTAQAALDGQDGPDGPVITGLWTDGNVRRPLLDPAQADDDALADVRAQLRDYFAGHRRHFDLPLRAPGTPFQQRVWQALQGIEYAGTASYGQIARSIGVPTAMRAVGGANGRNPISIIVPCHRVVGANGTLTGYAGGMTAKQWLLDHERRHSAGAGA